MVFDIDLAAVRELLGRRAAIMNKYGYRGHEYEYRNLKDLVMLLDSDEPAEVKCDALVSRFESRYFAGGKAEEYYVEIDDRDEMLLANTELGAIGKELWKIMEPHVWRRRKSHK